MEGDFDPVAASGESAYRGSRLLTLNEVSLNGDSDVEETEPGKFTRKGGYFRKRILIGATRDQKPEEVNLGQNISVIFLKIRRKLVERGQDGKIVLSTNEHNSAYDAVDLYGDKGFIETRNAKAIREAHPGLRTVQIVYALLMADIKSEPELVRLTVKGASLGSDAKDAATTDFYKYIGGFSKDEHMWEYVTNLSAVLEKGQKSYYCIDFKRGDKLDEGFQKMAIDRMKEVHFNCVEVENSLKEKRAAYADAAPTPAEGTGIEHPKDEPNPDDIPF